MLLVKIDVDKNCWNKRLDSTDDTTEILFEEITRLMSLKSIVVGDSDVRSLFNVKLCIELSESLVDIDDKDMLESDIVSDTKLGDNRVSLTIVSDIELKVDLRPITDSSKDTSTILQSSGLNLVWVLLLLTAVFGVGVDLFVELISDSGVVLSVEEKRVIDVDVIDAKLEETLVIETDGTEAILKETLVIEVDVTETILEEEEPLIIEDDAIDTILEDEERLVIDVGVTEIVLGETIIGEEVDVFLMLDAEAYTTTSTML